MPAGGAGGGEEGAAEAELVEPLLQVVQRLLLLAFVVVARDLDVDRHEQRHGHGYARLAPARRSPTHRRRNSGAETKLRRNIRLGSRHSR